MVDQLARPKDKMEVYWFSEQAQGYVSDGELEKFESGRMAFPNAHFDPAKAHVLYNEYHDQYALADEVGFDSIMTNEHHAAYWCGKPAVNLDAAILTKITKNVKIAILGNVIAVNDSIRMAEEVAMLDCYSGGRIISGFVRGGAVETLQAGIDPTQNRERFEEAHDLIMKCWTEPGPFRYEGKHYQYRVVNPWVLPMQKPRPDIWFPGIGNFGTLTLNDSTVSGNSALNDGGGISNFDTLTLNNSIVADHIRGGDCLISGLTTSLGHNLDSDGSCILTATGDQPSANANLGPLQDNGGRPKPMPSCPGSDAIDMGTSEFGGGCTDDSGSAFATDQRGFPRPVDGGSGTVRCDIGAFEFALPTSITITKSALPADGANFGHSLTFVNLPPRQYQVSEVVPVGWNLDHITCTTQDADDTTVVTLPGVLIDLDGAEEIVCSFVNTSSAGVPP